MIKRLDIKFVLILIITAVVPMFASLYFVRNAVKLSLSAGLNRDIAASLDNSLLAYRNFIEAQKTSQKLFLTGAAASAEYMNAFSSGNPETVRSALAAIIKKVQLLSTQKNI